MKKKRSDDDDDDDEDGEEERRRRRSREGARWLPFASRCVVAASFDRARYINISIGESISVDEERVRGERRPDAIQFSYSLGCAAINEIRAAKSPQIDSAPSDIRIFKSDPASLAPHESCPSRRAINFLL